MPRKRRFSEDPFGTTIERLAGALGVEPEHFVEYRLRVITERLEQVPGMIDRLYKQLSGARKR